MFYVDINCIFALQAATVVGSVTLRDGTTVRHVVHSVSQRLSVTEAALCNVVMLRFCGGVTLRCATLLYGMLRHIALLHCVL